jgi:endonuclease/exonuclease/phosphatase family metal-dependent hydrolase
MNRLSFKLLFILLLCGIADGQTTPEQPRTVRVLTYNIHHGEGTDRRLDLERLARVIESAKPDLVALQEVDRGTQRTGEVDQATVLGELTRLHAVFGKAMDYQGGGYGLAVLSRWPLSVSRTHPLPSAAGIEPRAVLEVRLQPGEGAAEIALLVTHLDAKSDPAARTMQVARIRELFPLARDNVPMLLAGDFNAKPGSAILDTLLTDWSDSAAGASFLTGPAGTPRSRIDYGLFRPATRWRVLETCALEEAVASDHRAVLAVLELAP